MFGFNRYLYLVVTQGRLKATELKDGRTIERCLKPASHPRTPIGNFENLEKIFSQAINELEGNSFFKPSPIVFLHLLDDIEGGYTQIEIRAFKEAALGGGAREIFMPESKTILTAQQLLTKDFIELDDA
ncbi:hypothetical protein DZA50_03855 [Kangiella sp. HD9-110m-PIT-SAG07]|nr:hypothetical protein DZA50_03855 [Kangiella sp. HD9-110m-PIT-SAG07]